MFNLNVYCYSVLGVCLVLLISCVQCEWVDYRGCDFFENIELGRTYDVYSPFYPNNYPTDTKCRWSKCAPYGTFIVINCTVLQIPTYTGCDVNGDRLEVSLRGCQELNDANNHCTQPFVTYTMSNALVMALKTGPNSPGGKFLCQIYAQQGPLPAPQPVSPSRYGSVNPYPQLNTYYPSSQQQQNSFQPMYQPSYPAQQSNYRSSSYPQSNYPQQSSYPQTYNAQQSSYPQSSYPQSSYPQSNYPQSSYPSSQPGYPRPAQTYGSSQYPQRYPQSPSSYPGSGYQIAQRQNYPMPNYTPSQDVYHPMSPEQNQDQCICGQRKRPRLLNGENIDIEYMPFACGLIDLNMKQVFCGCTIISRNFILTAAHCLSNRTIDTIGCIVGTTNYARAQESQFAATYPLLASEIYGEYNSLTMLNDIAIARTSAIEFNPAVSPVCLPISPRLAQPTYEYSQVEVAGYGETSFGGPVSPHLQVITLDVISRDQCNKNYPYQVTEGQMCTLTPGKDTCNFDDGSGFCHVDTYTGRSVLVGLPSYGVGCGSRIPRVATRVANYVPWILQVIKESVCVI